MGYLAAEKEVVKMTKVGVHPPGCRDICWLVGERRPRKCSTVPTGGWQWAQPPVKLG